MSASSCQLLRCMQAMSGTAVSKQDISADAEPYAPADARQLVCCHDGRVAQAKPALAVQSGQQHGGTAIALSPDCDLGTSAVG